MFTVQSCTFCTGSPAHTFCPCSSPEHFLCIPCADLHYSDYPSHLPLKLPLAAFGHHRNPGYFLRLQARIHSFESRKQEITAGLSDIDQCIVELRDRTSRLIAGIRDMEQRYIDRLLILKYELELTVKFAAEEAAKTMYDDEPMLQNPISKMMRNSGKLDPLFTFSFKSTKKYIKKTIALTYHAAIHRKVYPLFPQIHQNSIKLFTLKTGETVIRSLSVCFTPGAVFCFINEKSLLCLGGDNPSVSSAYILALPECTLRPLSPMLLDRGFPGVLKYGNFVYVFGGTRNSPAEVLGFSEKFAVTDQDWRALPRMAYPKFAFTACLFGDKVLMPVPSQPLEVFNLLMETFAVLPISFAVGESLAGVVSIIVHGEIVAVTASNLVGKLRLDGETTFRVGVLNDDRHQYAVSNVHPVRMGKDLFWVRAFDGSMVKFNMDSMDVCEFPFDGRPIL